MELNDKKNSESLILDKFGEKSEKSLFFIFRRIFFGSSRIFVG